MTGSQCVHLTICGHVQGVWFRAWTVKTAHHLGLTGWVRNRFDGSVEALACGPPAAIDRFITACRQGPPLAHVSDVRVVDAAPELLSMGNPPMDPMGNPIDDFIQKPTV